MIKLAATGRPAFLRSERRAWRSQIQRLQLADDGDANDDGDAATDGYTVPLCFYTGQLAYRMSKPQRRPTK